MCVWSRWRPVMDDVVVVHVHEHGHRLADDQRHPHRRVAIVTVEEAAHEPSQGNLQACGQVK